MDTVLQDIVLGNSDEIVKKWINEVEKNSVHKYSLTISEELFDSTNREFVNVIFVSVQNQGSKDDLKDFAERIINFGWPLNYLTEGMQAFRRVTTNFIIERSETLDAERFKQVLESVDEWVDPIVNFLVSEYSGSWESTVSLQKVALQELSAPLIPVMDGITVMPLIGTIDTERAKLIMENLLEGAIKHNAEVVLIDITGVPVVDTMVAHHIIQAAEAVRLVGSTCILVGIRPEIAQTIVNLGIDLSKFPTKSSLRKGFQSALEITDRAVVNLKDKGNEMENMIDSLNKG
ncbi:rsbT co-antagonist protein RsbR [Salirhabdus euzebyi]|uniref:RsbT co-antagonist protein RsbR n=1 Tax=Salirhabdus euzebyi TaxID=394506 RepID=A0A841Q6N4_9BACI|nr:RsbT co-antagonist protein RsbRA [Salirhabdus euzebyi]MBB6454189.1 rsbT co-antagonist protein RsbR [Salirhabdus euzebyi]